MPGKAEPPGNRGTLFVIATPIGNLGDITLRALRVLGEVDAVACEDTRQTLKLLNHYGLKKRLISYFHPRENRKIPEILHLLQGGKDVALVSDAGTPSISDPGYPLINVSLEAGIAVVPIPGASALTAALSASGLPTHKFLFAGFPPPKKTRVRKCLQSLKEEEATLIFYLPTRKIAAFTALVQEVLGERRMVIAREMTKVHEEFLRGRPEDIIGKLSKTTLKGEATVLVEGQK